MRIFAFDPGGTTGWAYHSTEADIWAGGQLGPHEHHKELYFHLDTAYEFTGAYPDVVIYEAFNYQIRHKEGTDMPGVVLISREYIGVIKLWCELTETQIVKQQPSVVGDGGPTWCKDEALKRMGLHTAGAPHQNDATRHLLYYLVTKLKMGSSLLQKLR